MQIDKDKIDEMVLALLHLTGFENHGDYARVERSGLGYNESTPREGIHKRPSKQG